MVQLVGIEPTGLSLYVPNVARYQVTVYNWIKFFRSVLLNFRLLIDSQVTLRSDENGGDDRTLTYSYNSFEARLALLCQRLHKMVVPEGVEPSRYSG